MLINYELNKKGKIISWWQEPYDPELPSIEIEKPYEEIFLDYSEIRDGKIYTDMKEVNEGRIKEGLRERREVECFPIINRGKLWYDTLTTKQLKELNEWYQAWLNVTETLIVPDKPSWLK